MSGEEYIPSFSQYESGQETGDPWLSATGIVADNPLLSCTRSTTWSNVIQNYSNGNNYTCEVRNEYLEKLVQKNENSSFPLLDEEINESPFGYPIYNTEENFTLESSSEYFSNRNNVGDQAFGIVNATFNDFSSDYYYDPALIPVKIEIDFGSPTSDGNANIASQNQSTKQPNENFENGGNWGSKQNIRSQERDGKLFYENNQSGCTFEVDPFLNYQNTETDDDPIFKEDIEIENESLDLLKMDYEDDYFRTDNDSLDKLLNEFLVHAFDYDPSKADSTSWSESRSTNEQNDPLQTLTTNSCRKEDILIQNKSKVSPHASDCINDSENKREGFVLEKNNHNYCDVSKPVIYKQITNTPRPQIKALQQKKKITCVIKSISLGRRYRKRTSIRLNSNNNSVIETGNKKSRERIEKASYHSTGLNPDNNNNDSIQKENVPKELMMVTRTDTLASSNNRQKMDHQMIFPCYGQKITEHLSEKELLDHSEYKGNRKIIGTEDKHSGFILKTNTDTNLKYLKQQQGNTDVNLDSVPVKKINQADRSSIKKKDISLTIIAQITEEKYECFQCGSVLKNRQNFIRHLKMQHEKTYDKIFRCSQCDFESRWRQSLYHHEKCLHSKNIELLTCPSCDYTTKFKHNLIAHKKKHRNKAPFNCDSCSFQSKWKSSLDNHIRTMHDENAQLYKCSKCSFQTKLKVDLASHEQGKHKKAKLLKCDQCEYKTKCRRYLLRHMSANHKSILFECPICSAKFGSKYNLNKHVRVRYHGEK